jgi:uncharacterized protein (DUF697 family)/predicted GTPase
MTEPLDEQSQSAVQKLTTSAKAVLSLPKSWLTKIWQSASGNVSQFVPTLPTEAVATTIAGWFKVDEAAITAILTQVKAELPTTEALLIGKPQAGKSSIVRALTGVSDSIIGPGFRPHTRHTQRYSYPTEELPLIIFTDTVGLGDGIQETAEVILELTGELQAPRPAGNQDSSQRGQEETESAETPQSLAIAPTTPDRAGAKVILLTLKITDFATETLQQIARKIRQQHPEVPCLLAVTCLHELYPPEAIDHPPYPPDDVDVQRAFAEIQRNFAGLFDRAVLIDFTLESDEFHPVNYGLEPLVDALAELLPEAEARAMQQLLADRAAGGQIGDLYREAGRRYILPFSIMAGALAALPIPLATMPVLTALQVSMVGFLGQLYGQKLTPAQAGGVVSAIAGGFVAQAIGRELIKFIPGLGSVVAASWATTYTWALGESACVYFGDLMGGKTPDPHRIQGAMKKAFKTAQDRFRASHSSESSH